MQQKRKKVHVCKPFQFVLTRKGIPHHSKYILSLLYHAIEYLLTSLYYTI